MNVELQNISINRPVVKINTEMKVIDRPTPPEPPEKKFTGAGNAILVISDILYAALVNATEAE